MSKILNLGFIPKNNDVALLVLRVLIGFSLFMEHGLFKISNFSHLWGHFLNPLFVGPYVSLLFSTLSDGICSVLIFFGIATRPAALICAIDTLVVFIFLDHMAFHPGDGELVLLYFAGMIALILMGGGKYSVDHKFLGVK